MRWRVEAVRRRRHHHAVGVVVVVRPGAARERRRQQHAVGQRRHPVGRRRHHAVRRWEAHRHRQVRSAGRRQLPVRRRGHAAAAAGRRGADSGSGAGSRRRRRRPLGARPLGRVCRIRRVQLLGDAGHAEDVVIHTVAAGHGGRHPGREAEAGPTEEGSGTRRQRERQGKETSFDATVAPRRANAGAQERALVEAEMNIRTLAEGLRAV